VGFLDASKTHEEGSWHVVNTGPTADEEQEECDAFDLLFSTNSDSVFPD
jgi:hypothetical protein